MGGLGDPLTVETMGLIFGPEASGPNIEDFARTSKKRFVRSQVQVAVASPLAKGRVMTASEALSAFGHGVLFAVAKDGSAPLVDTALEPAKTLKDRRRALRLSPEQLAKRTGLTLAVVQTAETPGEITSIRSLEKMAQTLALDERVLGFSPGASGDRELGVRLRQLSEARDVKRFSPAAVMHLAEAAWVISRQDLLSRMNGTSFDFRARYRFRFDGNYAYPAWEVGFRLAEETRRALGLTPEEPIVSVRQLIEETLGLPMIQQRLERTFSGATLANRSVRGIVVNELGMNHNVWVRRMTLCHELGHLLWDPEERLNRLKVDDYDVLEESIRDTRKDPVEIRANAFAIAFLAPPAAVRRIAEEAGDASAVVDRLMQTYGISGTAARRHVANVTKIDTEAVTVGDLSQPSDDWIGRENLAIDWFPLKTTPMSRRGRFAWLTAKALKEGVISVDTAATYLYTAAADIEAAVDEIIDALT